MSSLPLETVVVVVVCGFVGGFVAAVAYQFVLIKDHIAAIEKHLASIAQELRKK